MAASTRKNKILKYSIVLLVFLSCSNTSWAQSHLPYTQKADSLSEIGNHEAALAFRKKALDAVAVKDRSYPLLKASLHLEQFYVFNSQGKESLAIKEAQSAVRELSDNLQDREAALLLLKAGKAHYEYLYNESRYQESLKIALELLALVNKSSLVPYDKAELFSNIGHLYIYLNESALAIRYYEEAIDAMLNHPSPDLNKMALCYNQLAFCYDNCGFVSQSFDNYEKAFNIWHKHFIDEYQYVSTALHNLIHSYLAYGDATNMSKYLQIYEAFYQRCEQRRDIPQKDQYQMKVQLALARVSLSTAKKDTTTAIREIGLLEKLHRSKENPSKESSEISLMNSYEHIGILFRELKSYDRALYYFEQAKPSIADDYRLMKYFANTAITLYFMGEYDRALINANQCLTYFRPPYSGSSYYTLQVLKAELLQAKGSHEEALNLIASFLGEYLDKPLSIEQLKALTYSDFDGLNSANWITILSRCGDVCRKAASSNNGSQWNETALVFYRIASEMFKTYYLNGEYNRDLDYLHRKGTDGIFEVFTSDHQSHSGNLAQYISLLENNTSRQIWKKFLSNNEQYFSSDVEIIRQKNLLLMQKKLMEEEQMAEDALLKSQLGDIEKQLTKKVALSFFENASIDVQSIQKQLRSGELLLKYYVMDSTTYLLTLSRDTIRLQKLATSQLLESASNDYLNTITSLGSDYQALSQKLATLLFPMDITSNANTLIIIPDRFLWKIPFESLMLKDGKFLVEHLAVRYAYDLLQLTLQLPKLAGKKRNFLAAFAPDYSNTGYAGIYNNVQEATYISSQTQGSLFVQGMATKSNFVDLFTDFRMHHLALHAEQDPQNYEQSALVFANGEKMFFHELYQLNLPSELVVLSACNTGVGQLMPGEGTMSLSRALTYAGVRSSVNSLWPVPDKETAEIMVSFYEYLQKGKPKDEALAYAKRDFLLNNPLKGHPYYWAGFVLIGEANAIFEQDRWGYIYWLAIPLFAAMFYLGRKRWRPTNKA